MSIAQKLLPPTAQPQLAALLLRFGLAFVFTYAAVDSFIHPDDWVGYLPHFMTIFIPAETMLNVISAYELALAGWLLIGKYTRYAAILSALTLAGILAANLGILGVTFRDVGLVFAALALVFVEPGDQNITS
ncbi:MAG TPA: MauE/DoxX family redox-associated membrane protein [Candidatus Acidoferrum sp.]|nr:MauE/DoxX family redox-associated membrane protein [Candidatus Acidoferrum sp.]